MTANMIKGKGFRGALQYNLEKVAKNVADILDHSFVEVSEKSILKEVQMVRVMRPNLQKFFYHTSINFPPTEDLSNATMIQIGQEYLRDSGFTQHQYIMFRHHDANHPHLHILVNRIGYDGKVLSDSNDFARCEEILRRLEKKYNLAEVISSQQARERAATKNEVEMMKRTSDVSAKIKLQVIIRKTLQDNQEMNLSQFVSRLAEKGIDVLFNQASTGYVSGISYRLGDFVMTGSKLGSDFKWKSIANRMGYVQERDHSVIKDANSRTNQRSRPPEVNRTQRRIPRDAGEKWSPEFGKEFDLKRLFDIISAPGNHTTGYENREAGFSGRPKKKKKRRGRRI
jgi:hypothetical protein